MKTTTSPRLARALVLASGSAYRRALLERLGLPFTVAVPAIDESPQPDEAPADTAVRLAEAKARGVAGAHPDALIIGSDQVADFHGTAVGKPRDPADALEQLRAMQGRTIVFHTGLALLDARSGLCRRALVDVASTFRQLDDAALTAYLERDRPYDCAGSVKIETLGIALFTRVASDDPTALIGLPLIRLTDMLIAEGLQPL
ncbi:MAG TPA: Maf family nucleotide pyrophosphatase [Casimicrobiaceae bacterium]|nr:Maf family nucleotide pyrophosphatase [Casimicrobiaceae bacterium]